MKNIIIVICIFVIALCGLETRQYKKLAFKYKEIADKQMKEIYELKELTQEVCNITRMRIIGLRYMQTYRGDSVPELFWEDMWDKVETLSDTLEIIDLGDNDYGTAENPKYGAGKL